MKWTVQTKDILIMTLYFVFLGVALHDYLHALWEICNCYSELLSLQGGYLGFVGLIIAFLLLFFHRSERVS